MTEHGWNDPPVFSFSSLQSGANRKLQLNKRVNHLSSTINDNSSPTESKKKGDSTSTSPTVATLNSVSNSSTLPPPPPPSSSSFGVKDKTIQSDINDGKCAETNGMDASKAQKSRTFDQILTSLTELTERHCETVQKRIHDEIKRRLAILSKQWEEGLLSPPVQNEMAKLTEALERGDCQTADSIHIALMVDHTSEVNQWMVGVKRLIATMRTTNQA